jgi:hypothetical protein
MRRRRLVIGVIIIALSIGLVFSILPYLQPAPPHFSLSTPRSMTVSAGNETYPGFNALQLPNMSTNGNFYVAISVSGGNASFCPMQDAYYEPWSQSYTVTKSPALPSQDCVVQTGQISQETLVFRPTTPGTWWIVALNSNPSQITISFSPA